MAILKKTLEDLEFDLVIDNIVSNCVSSLGKTKAKSIRPSTDFNDIDFSDECIVRSSLLPNRIQSYIQAFNNYKNNPYGFHDAVDVVMEYAKKNEKVAFNSFMYTYRR